MPTYTHAPCLTDEREREWELPRPQSEDLSLPSSLPFKISISSPRVDIRFLNILYVANVWKYMIIDAKIKNFKYQTIDIFQNPNIGTWHIHWNIGPPYDLRAFLPRLFNTNWIPPPLSSLRSRQPLYIWDEFFSSTELPASDLNDNERTWLLREYSL